MEEIRTHKVGFSVVGLGRAGKARCRSIVESSMCNLVSTHSRRNVGSSSWNEILADPLVEAVVICTENSSHGSFIREALMANKHVAVEYPLVNDSAEAQELYELAQRQNKVLHCEFIGLLTEAHLLRKKMLHHNLWSKIQCSFQGGVYSWIEQEMMQGNYAQLSVGRVQALWDLVGPLTLREAYLTRSEIGYQLEVQFWDSKQKEIQLIEKRAAGVPRKQSWDIVYQKEPKTLNVATSEHGLFLQDLNIFIAQIHGKEKAYVTSAAVLEVLQMANQINDYIQKYLKP